MQYLVTKHNIGLKADEAGKTQVAHQGQILETGDFANADDIARFMKADLIAPWDPKKDNGEGQKRGGIMDPKQYEELMKVPAPAPDKKPEKKGDNPEPPAAPAVPPAAPTE